VDTGLFASAGQVGPDATILFDDLCAFRKAKVHRTVTPLPENLPRGFVVTGLHAGVKKSGVLDVALIVSKQPKTAVAACFTRNAFQAAPVLVCKDVLEQGSGRARVAIVNSGCANAVTGKQGMGDTWEWWLRQIPSPIVFNTLVRRAMVHLPSSCRPESSDNTSPYPK
jgi:hypothetical protein